MPRAAAWVAGTFLCALFVAGGCTTGPSLSKGPYLQNATATAVTVQWETEEPAAAKVRFRRVAPAGGGERAVEGELFEAVPPRKDLFDKKGPPGPRYLYRARLSDLEPGSEYAYTVGVDFAKEPPAEHRFRTWSESAAGPLTFIAYGDTRSQPKVHAAIAAAFEQHRPAFILNDGDLVYDGDQYAQWGEQFFAPLAGVIDRVPMFIARGNHEKSAKYILRFFDMPGGRMYYSFDCGPVHVVVLDVDKADSKAVAWLEKDLAATRAPWRVAMLHRPVFNLEGHKSDEHRATYLPLFLKYGVDVVLAGHSHMYERFVPLRPAGGPAGGPITFMTVGGGGAPLHRVIENPLLAEAESAYSYSVFTVTDTELSMRTLTPDGREIDSFSVSKAAGRYADAYLDKARPMEEAMLEQGLLKIETPRVARMPEAGRTFDVALKANFPGFAGAVTLSVRLAVASEGHYEMAPVEVQVSPKLKDVKAPLWIRPLEAVTQVEREVYERVKEKDVLVKKKFLAPEIRLVVTARAAGFERTREMVGVNYSRSSVPAATSTAASDTGAKADSDAVAAPAGR